MRIISRTCTELRDDEPGSPQPLSVFRQHPAYVLLGDPGMGKTTALDEEQRAVGEAAVFVTARDFATFDTEDHPEWQGKTLFIDGLDEIRAGRNDPRSPMDRIRRNLDKLGKPRFRLSCRHADWLGTDQQSLRSVGPSSDVTVLRLDPLDDHRAAELLRGETDIADVDAFIAEARERRIEGTLTNPQTLTMLAVATRGGRWPGSRTETFELACRGLATERNAEHLSVQPTGDVDRIVDAAGRICAAVLLSGSRGCATTPRGVSEDYPDITKCGVTGDDWRRTVASGLFQYPAQGRTEPVHRHIAEYVAASHIAGLIEDGLPSGRALALMTAPDGTVTSELRGLSAWLAAHSGVARHDLIQRDPIGLALYGDIHAFSADEKRALFASLVREPRRMEPMHEAARGLAALATPSMRGVFEEVLSARATDSDDQQLVVELTLRLLREAAPLAGLSPLLLLNIVRDENRWPRVRDAALVALVHYGQQAEHDADLVALLGDIHEKRLDDPDSQLLGRLLSTLYPRLIPPDVIWDYFTDRPDTEQVIGGAHMTFWLSDLVSRSSEVQIAELLDQCRARVGALEAASDSTLERCVARLLGRALETKGDAVDTPRLYGWLDTAVRLGVGQFASRAEAQVIRSWIGEHPDRHIDTMLEGIGRSPRESWYAPYEVFQRFFGSQVDSMLYESCLHAAKSMALSKPDLAQSLLRFAMQTGHVSPKRAREIVADQADLRGVLDAFLQPVPTPPDLVRLEEQRQARHEEQLRQAEQRLGQLKAHQAALLENRAPASVLHHLARTYFGSFVDFAPADGLKRLEELVQPDTDLLGAAVAGLRGAIKRDDMPSIETIRALRRDSKQHYLCWPYLAGLAEAERTGLDPGWWTDDRMRTALASYFGYVHADYEPAWYRHLIEQHATTVAEVQIQFAGDMLRDGVDPTNANVWHLAFDRGHAKLAGLASIPLLRSFPLRAPKRLLPTLEELLLAALRHAHRPAFRELIEEKLSLKSLPASQRERWLAAGCALAPVRYEQAATDFVSAGRLVERTLHFASFFNPQERAGFPVEAATPARLPAMLIRLLGQVVGPDEHSEGVVTPAMDASTLVQSCIRVLASSTGPAATNILTELRADPNLAPWHRSLAIAADDQQVSRRDSEYRHPTIEQVGATLDNDAPTGPADLAALVLDRFDCIAARIRATNTDDWKQLWNEDQYGRPTTPKPEESCTRALLSDLRQLLPRGVSAEPEARHSNDTRADLNLSYEDAHVPVEVKRQSRVVARVTRPTDWQLHARLRYRRPWALYCALVRERPNSTLARRETPGNPRRTPGATRQHIAGRGAAQDRHQGNRRERIQGAPGTSGFAPTS